MLLHAEAVHVLNIWGSHYETLGLPSTYHSFDKEVFNYVYSDVNDITTICLNLDYQISYDEVKTACHSLPNGKAGGHDGSSPCYADDLTLFATFPNFLSCMMNTTSKYS